MLAHVSTGKIEAVYNRAYVPRWRELARVWANLLSAGLRERAVPAFSSDAASIS